MDFKVAGEKRLLQLNELDEFRHEAYENAKTYRERTKAWHDKHIMRKGFQSRQQVLFFNSRLKLFSGKLKSKWFESFVITQVFPYGSMKLSHPEKGNFKVNGQRLKPYFGGAVDKCKEITILKAP